LIASIFFPTLEGLDDLGSEAPIGLEFDIGMFHEEIEFRLDPAQHADPLSNTIDSLSKQHETQRYRGQYDEDNLIHAGPPLPMTNSICSRAGYGTFPRTAQADAVSDRGPSGEPEQYASRTASLIRAFRAVARLAK
jgi:hypothetical protein